MLTVVAASRNDDHGGRMIARINTFIRGLAAQACKHEMPVELILVEWNPPMGVPSLLHALTWPCTSRYFRSRVIVVSREIHAQMRNADKLRFYQMIAKNVGIRRASYPWVLATNTDLLFPDEIFNALKGELDPTCFYRAIRADVGLRVLDESLSVPEQLRVCRDNVVRVHGAPGAVLHTGACGDFTLMAKADWLRLRGYTEFDLWSIHIDTVFLYWAVHQGYKECLIPDAQCYHLEHDNAWVTNPGYGEGKPRMHSSTAAACQEQMRRGKFEHNGPDWGLGDMILPDYTAPSAPGTIPIEHPESPRPEKPSTNRETRRGYTRSPVPPQAQETPRPQKPSGPEESPRPMLPTKHKRLPRQRKTHDTGTGGMRAI
jgi:hypothetical protein